MSRLLGSYRCEACRFRSMTAHGLNTHIGKRHPGASLNVTGKNCRLYGRGPWRPAP